MCIDGVDVKHVRVPAASTLQIFKVGCCGCGPPGAGLIFVSPIETRRFQPFLANTRAPLSTVNDDRCHLRCPGSELLGLGAAPPPPAGQAPVPVGGGENGGPRPTPADCGVLWGWEVAAEAGLGKDLATAHGGDGSNLLDTWGGCNLDVQFFSELFHFWND